jgi:hypothetical protein
MFQRAGLAIGALEHLKPSFARREATPAASIPAVERLEDLIKESRRQKAVVVAVAVRQLAQVIAGPQKFVSLVDNDP